MSRTIQIAYSDARSPIPLLLLFLWSLSLLTPDATHAQDLEQIIRDWESIAAESPILHYHVTGERITFPNAHSPVNGKPADVSGGFPKEQVSHPYRHEFLADPETDRFRVRLEQYLPNVDRGRWNRTLTIQTKTADGINVFRPADKNPSHYNETDPYHVEYALGASWITSIGQITDTAILEAHGRFFVPSAGYTSPMELRDKHDLRYERESETENGRVIIVRYNGKGPGVTTTVELYLDPSHRHRVVRSRWFTNETLITDNEVSYTDYDSDEFRVAGLRAKRFNFTDGRPQDEYRCQCETAEVLESAPDNAFEIEIPAGAWVRDVAGDRNYQWNPPAPAWYERKLAWLLGVAGLIGAGWYGIRRRSARA